MLWTLPLRGQEERPVRQTGVRHPLSPGRATVRSLPTGSSHMAQKGKDPFQAGTFSIATTAAAEAGYGRRATCRVEMAGGHGEEGMKR